jgi:hypothetical protein
MILSYLPYLSFSTTFNNMSAFLISAGLGFIKEWILRNYVVFYWRNIHKWTRATSFTRFLYHAKWCTQVGLSGMSDQLVAVDLLSDNTQHDNTSPVGFELTISAGKRSQTYALERAATGIMLFGCQKWGLLSRAILLNGGFCNRNGGCLLHSTDRTVNTFWLKWLIC